MPDSQLPPIWGPAYDERDLDALLSGETGSIPLALRPVESTLAALRTAATGRELADEAVARAAFRAFRAFAPAPLTPATEPWTEPPEPAAVTAHTLILPAAGGPRPARHRHRHRRPAAKGARRRRIAPAGAAVAALVVVGAVVTGALTGSIGELASFGRQTPSASASARPSGQSAGSQGLMARGAAREPSPSQKPTPPARPTPRPTPDPGSLCREYYGYFGHPTRAGWTAWTAAGAELSKLAGNQGKIFGYCLHYVDIPAGSRGPGPSTGTSAGGPGAAAGQNPGSGSLGTGSTGSGASSNGTGSSGTGSLGTQGKQTDQGASGDTPTVVGRP